MGHFQEELSGILDMMHRGAVEESDIRYTPGVDGRVVVSILANPADESAVRRGLITAASSDR